MRSFNQAIETAEVYSPAEERFNRRRRTVGLFLAPAVMAAIWPRRCRWPRPAHRMAAIMGLVVVLWVSEALPMAATAVLGPVLAVVLRVADARAALRAVCRSDHLPVHRQLHPGRGDVRPRRGPAHRVHRLVVEVRRAKRAARPFRLQRRGDGPLDVDQQHRDHGDDVSHRPGAGQPLDEERARRTRPAGPRSGVSRWA